MMALSSSKKTTKPQVLFPNLHNPYLGLKPSTPKKRKRRCRDDEDIIKAGDVLTDSEDDIERELAATQDSDATVSIAESSPTYSDVHVVASTPITTNEKKHRPASGKHVKITYNGRATKHAMVDRGLDGSSDKGDNGLVVLVKKTAIEAMKQENNILKQNNARLFFRCRELMTIIEQSRARVSNGSNNPPPSQQRFLPGSLASQPSLPQLVQIGMRSTSAFQPTHPNQPPDIVIRLAAENRALIQQVQHLQAGHEALRKKTGKIEEDNQNLTQACLEFARLEKKQELVSAHSSRDGRQRHIGNQEDFGHDIVGITGDMSHEGTTTTDVNAEVLDPALFD